MVMGSAPGRTPGRATSPNGILLGNALAPSRGGGLPQTVRTGGSGDYGLAPEPLLKAVAQGARRRPKGPHHVEHYVSESVRRYTGLAGGILDDQTPHLDAYTLRSLAGRNVVLQAVIHTIINQVASHFVRPVTDQAIGVKVVQKDRKKMLTEGAANEAKRIEDIIFNGGVVTENKDTGEPGVWDSHGEETADDLETAVRKIMRDSLILDRAFIVTEGSMSGTEPVLYWKHADAGLIRLADTKIYEPQIRNGQRGTDDLTGRVKYVQMAPDMDIKIDREYAWNEGMFAFRNPKPELMSFGMGSSEVEQCLMAVTGILYTMQANQDWFTANHVPQGLLTIFGNFERNDVESLRGQLASEVSAVTGSIWEVPVLAAQPMQGNAVTWTPFIDRTRMDMVSKTYLELCVALVAAVFQIAPEEFGFHGFGGPSGTIGGDGGVEDKLQHSQHKGLLPKVLWFKRFLTRAIVERINPDFELIVQGLDAVYNPEQMLKAQLDLALMANGMTMNQVNARNDQPPIVDPIDEELWAEIKERHDHKFYATERERVTTIVQEYKAQGGQLGKYPDAPVNNPGAMQIWVAEHLQEQQQTQEQMGEMAGQEQANAQQGEAAETQGARDQMGQLAQGEAAGAQQGEQMERQGAQEQMSQFAAGEQEFDQGNRMADQEAAQAGELRIPMAEDAGYPDPLGKKGQVQKAVRVYRVGPRDA